MTIALVVHSWTKLQNNPDNQLLVIQYFLHEKASNSHGFCKLIVWHRQSPDTHLSHRFGKPATERTVTLNLFQGLSVGSTNPEIPTCRGEVWIFDAFSEGKSLQIARRLLRASQ